MSTPGEIRKAFLDAVAAGDVKEILGCYGPGAVLVAPEGRFEGGDQIESYYQAQLVPFSASLTVAHAYDTADAAITEWVFNGTHTGPLELPGGQTVPPTGKRVTQRGVDVAVVAGGLISEHRVYYDQVEFLTQLDLLPEGA